MIYNRVKLWEAGSDVHRVAEIIIPGHEQDAALRGLSAVISEYFLAGAGTEVTDAGGIGQSGIEMAIARLFSGVVFRGDVYVVDRIAGLLDAARERDESSRNAHRQRVWTHDMPIEEFAAQAALPTDYITALYVDVSPFSRPRTVMPPNAPTVDRITELTVYPEDTTPTGPDGSAVRAAAE